MLAMADRKGRVYAAIPGLANTARVTIEECEQALARFMSPDKYSRTEDFEGRRIEPIDGGWRLLNHAKYREMRDAEERAIQNRDAQERYRSKQTRLHKPEISQGKPPSAQAEAEAETESNPSCAFSAFWDAYPRKKSKGQAEKAWQRLSPDGALAVQILAAVERAKASADWQREGGKFIPYPATWLNARGWEDELQPAVAERFHL